MKFIIMLNEIAKYHTEWIKMVKSLGGGDYSEDIVQDMYLKIHKYATPEKIFINNKLNKFYIYLTLRSILFSEFRNKENVSKESMDNYLHLPYNESNEENDAFNKVSLLVDVELNNWHWYDKMLFQYYRDNKTSIRKIANKTGISWVSIFHTLKKCKNKIKDKHLEDWQDYANQDYEYIK